jgi:hypothetical protein
MRSLSFLVKSRETPAVHYLRPSSLFSVVPCLHKRTTVLYVYAIFFSNLLLLIRPMNVKIMPPKPTQRLVSTIGLPGS